MKSNIQKVYSKLPKVELSKVELGLVDNFIKSAKAVSNMYGDSYSEKTNIKTIVKKTLRGLEMADSAGQRSLKVGIDLEKQAKNLGVELPSDYNQYKSRLISDIEDIDKAIRIYKQINSQVDF